MTLLSKIKLTSLFLDLTVGQGIENAGRTFSIVVVIRNFKQFLIGQVIEPRPKLPFPIIFGSTLKSFKKLEGLFMGSCLLLFKPYFDQRPIPELPLFNFRH